MGNRFSRRRDAPASSAGNVATEQKTEAEPAAADQAENSETTPTQEAVETEKLDVTAKEAGTTEACLPTDECVSGSKGVPCAAASDPQNDAESEPAAKETPPPVQTEPLASAIKPPEPEGFAQPEPVTEAQLAPKPEPEPALEPEPSSHREADAEPTSELPPITAGPPQQHTDPLNQESLPEPVLPSPPLIDWSVPDIASAPAPIPVSLSPDESSNISAAERCEGSSTPEPEKFTEFLENPVEVEAAGCMKTPGNDVEEENISDVLQKLELKGNDLLNDLIQSEAKIPDDTPTTDLSTAMELM
ncbi:proteoglycan 4-like [Kryptolebias marmoratus]|uniref:proteoglycan 4-like n=1 Tax=Kryptolebias marmoratus TaxID=37003 RepID=UPI0007F8997C|nr:proteoglycan 4-like [Kryptolebias marmoratus]